MRMDNISYTKYCLGCREDKSVVLFWKNKRTSDGLDRYCIECGKTRRKKDYADNKEKYSRRAQQYKQRPEFKEQYKRYQQTWLQNGGDVWLKDYQRSYAKNHAAERIQASKDWYKQHSTPRRDIQRKYRKDNSGAVSARVSYRRAQKKRAIPPWFEKTEVEALYEQCRLKSLQEGKIYHVDHIIPINNTDVCGLHCLDNLQIILAEDNLAKSNKLIL